MQELPTRTDVRLRPRVKLLWGILAALNVFDFSIWRFRPQCEQEWLIPSNSIIVGFYGGEKYLAIWSPRDNGILSIWDVKQKQLQTSVPVVSCSSFVMGLSKDGEQLAYLGRWRSGLADTETKDQ